MAWARASPLQSLCCLPQKQGTTNAGMEKLSPRAQAPLDAGKQPSALGLHDLPAQATRKADPQERGPQRTAWQELCWDQRRLCSPAAARPAAPVMYTSRIPSPLPRAEGWRQGSRHRRAQSIQPGGPLLPARCLRPWGAASVPPAAQTTLGHHPACCRQLPRTKPPRASPTSIQADFSFATSPTRDKTATPAPKPLMPPLHRRDALSFPSEGLRKLTFSACFPTQLAGSLQRWQGARLSRSLPSGAPLAVGVPECLRTGSVKSRLPGTARPSAPRCAAGGREQSPWSPQQG